MNKKYQIFREKVTKVISDSHLDIGIVYFILKDIFSEIESLYYAQLNKEMLEEANKINSNANNNKRKPNVSNKNK